ncbi:putative lipoprotein [Mycobacterium xenopi 4042]|uniref:Putative lipoprotein n=1 Tax=Mycobacterium xenopi 4042 TaxID=1299334 RepID=X8DXK9_MYCXE|nr:putative lipoprotein [Mycobacterium xenopi 4042]
MTVRRLTALALTAAVALVGCGHGSRATHPVREVVVASAPDSESVLLADIYAGALRSYGFPRASNRQPTR